MIRHTEKPSRVNGFLALTSLALACLALSAVAASGADAFTRTIADIEDPAVEAKVMSLEVQATRSLDASHHQYFGPEAGVILDRTIVWNHKLSGKADSSLAEGQMPQVTVRRNPTVVSIAGKVVTDVAEGKEELWYFVDGCPTSRTTTKSPLLDVNLEGFYRSGTSSSSGDPQVSLTTENLDPLANPCYDQSPPLPTQIQTFDSPTVTDTRYTGFGESLKPLWSPVGGDLQTTKGACGPEFCDFTISGRNKNSVTSPQDWEASGEATSTFDLRLRLEYPPEEPAPAPDTRIVKGPRKLLKTRSGKAKIAIAFRTTGPVGTKFRCRLNKRPPSSCSSPFKRKVGPGKHRFAVASVYRGKADRSPAVYQWTVKKKPRKPSRPNVSRDLLTPGTLLVGTDVPYFPFEFRAGPGYMGFDIDLVNALARKLRLQVRYKDTAFDTIFTDVWRRKFDLVASAATITPDRKRSVGFSKPYYEALQSLVVKRTSDIHSLADLAAAAIGVQRGTTGEAFARDETHAPRIVRFPSGQAAIRAVRKDRVDAAIIDRPVAEDALRKDRRQLRIARNLSTGEMYGLAMSKASPRLRRGVNWALDRIKADGTLKRIHRKWLGFKPPPSVTR